MEFDSTDDRENLEETLDPAETLAFITPATQAKLSEIYAAFPGDAMKALGDLPFGSRLGLKGLGIIAELTGDYETVYGFTPHGWQVARLAADTLQADQATSVLRRSSGIRFLPKKDLR